MRWGGLCCLLFLPVLSLAEAEAEPPVFDAGMYRCQGGDQPPRFFQRSACQLLTDPTTPFQPKGVVARATLPRPVHTLEPERGVWHVTQILIPSKLPRHTSASLGTMATGRRQAIVNNRRVGVGSEVDGGRVRAITRGFVVIAHDAGETRVPFDEPIAQAIAPAIAPAIDQAIDQAIAPAIAQVTEDAVRVRTRPLRMLLREVGQVSPRLLQQLANGGEVLIIHEGQPLARLRPVIADSLSGGVILPGPPQ